LTPSGDHLFPKSYDELAVELIDTLADRPGQPALRQVLGALTDKRVREWEPRLQGKPLAERVAALQAVYRDGDPYMSVEIGRNGIRLIERNCLFLNVASRRPALCSVTVSTLERLLGVKVVREERFQSGHGRCVFRVLTDEPIDPRRFRFALEGETPESPPR
jgi:predicted ArsR family transcriptional regulator